MKITPILIYFSIILTSSINAETKSFDLTEPVNSKEFKKPIHPKLQTLRAYLKQEVEFYKKTTSKVLKEQKK